MPHGHNKNTVFGYVYSAMSDSLQPHGLYLPPPYPAPQSTEFSRILDWVAISYSRGSSLPRYQTPHLLHLLLWQVDSLPLGIM